MPTITADLKDLQNLLKKYLTIDELIPMMDYAKAELKAYDRQTGELRIELKDTNRPDLWCVEGIARQIRFSYDQPDYTALNVMPYFNQDKVIIVNENIRQIRPYICAFIAKGCTVSEQFLEQLINTQEKLSAGYGKKRELAATGIYNAQYIKFPLAYKAADPDKIKFIPLGAYTEMYLNQITEKHPKGIEYSALLKKYNQYPVLIDAADDVISFPPIINSQKSGKVIPGIDCLFIEVTGMNLDTCLHIANILSYNLKDRGFAIELVSVEYPFMTPYGRKLYAPYPLLNEVVLKKPLIESYTGCKYSFDEVVTCFRRYGVMAEPLSELDDSLKVYTYPYRLDYIHAVDAVEDFLISTGYNTFDPVMPSSFTVGSIKPETRFEDRVREIMTWLGFEEVILNILTNKNDFVIGANTGESDLLEIGNPMSENYSCLRNSLLLPLLKVEANSFKSVYPHRIFEAGEAAIRDNNDNHCWITRSMLGVLIAHAEANFSEMGSCLAQLQYMLSCEMRINSHEFPLFIPGRSGQIVSDNVHVGMIGEVHPAVLEKWGIRMPCVMLEIDLSKLYACIKK